MSSHDENQRPQLSRRAFLKASAALSFAVMISPAGCKREGKATKSAAPTEKGLSSGAGASDGAQVGAWVILHPDGEVVIYNPAAEMGQGSMTALPLILAEEMDADWAKVRIEYSPVEPDIYGKRGGYGGMMTVGSRAVMGYFTQLRLAGAQIRKVLLAIAARELGVPEAELTTEPGAVVHAGSGKRVTFGELAAAGDVPEELPRVTEGDLKSPDDFRLIGTSTPRYDVPAKVDGSAQFSIDVKLPGMLYGMIQRSPVHGGSPKSYNAEEVRAVEGVVTTVELEHGVGVIASSVEAAMAARRELKIAWSEGDAAGFDSEEALAGYPKVLEDASVDARSFERKGDAARALERAKKRYQADYFADHVYHAQMEPLNAVAWAKESGDAEIWIGTQAPARARAAVAYALGVDIERVTMHRCYLGGGFGRRSSEDFAVEAAQLSKAVKKPVKLIWTRKDDLQYAKFRPMCLQRMTAGVGEDGKIVAWTHNLVGQGGRLLGSGVDIPYYDIPNQTIDMREVDHGLRVHYWRAVGHHYNKFAIEAFIDEIAADQGVDPVEFRRAMVSSPRAAKVLDVVAEMSGWGSPLAEGRARGVTLIERSGTHGAAVAEISLDRARGEIRVHRFWAALDAGIIVQPDNASAQIEGSIVMGLSAALKERVTFAEGVAQQSNYSDYPLLRMSEAPEIEVRFIDSAEAPSGIGEPGIPLTAGAVANAFGALTGKRLRHMPFTPERVRALL